MFILSIPQQMLSDVREAMLYQLGVDVSCEELNHFFTGKGKAALSGCAEWQQCFAVEKMLEFYYVHARDETLAKQIETMTGLTVSEVNVRVSGVNLGNE